MLHELMMEEKVGMWLMMCQLNQSIGIMTWFNVYNDNMWYPIFETILHRIILYYFLIIEENPFKVFKSLKILKTILYIYLE